MLMADMHNLCYLLVLAVAVGFVIYGFMLLLEKERSNENDVQTIQRQIRGFAFIMLAQVIVVLGMALCYGMSSNGKKYLKSLVRSA
jgi:type IV secretory pathway VirB2 component (pilin)